jgi:hypothetical protein
MDLVSYFEHDFHPDEGLVGIGPRISSSQVGSTPGGPIPRQGEKRIPSRPRPAPNPNPANYTVLKHEEHGNFLLLELHYHGCTNFEGRKLLVFRGTKLVDLMNQRFIDPHFSDAKGVHHPIARFEPNKEGWKFARLIADHDQKASKTSRPKKKRTWQCLHHVPCIFDECGHGYWREIDP